MLITKSEAGRQIGVTKQYMQNLENANPRPAFFVEDESGRVRIDTDHPDWKIKESQKGLNASVNKIKSESQRIKKSKGAVRPSSAKSSEPVPRTASDIDLDEQVRLAGIYGVIATSKIKQERAIQEEIKTAEIKKELAPIGLVKHFFSFAESMIQRGYRRYEEISPELEALYRAGKSKEAVKLLLREQETINADAVAQLKKSMIEEGFKIKK
jgi:hypothetical protein